ncbi:MAG: methionine synthase [Tissierellaceae bacterium]
MSKLEIDRNEVLRYLGYRNQSIDEATDKIIDQSIEEIGDLMEARYVYKFFDLKKDDGFLLEGTNLRLGGRDIKGHLAEADSCIVMGVTLGHRVDRAIRYYEKLSMARAMILDACASTAVEAVCDRVNEDLLDMVRVNKRTLTSRYSPGYGDLSLDMQSPILDVLGAKGSIGLSATLHNILIPRKSVTAIMGIVDEDYRQADADCIGCPKYDDCSYRKGGGRCGY